MQRLHNRGSCPTISRPIDRSNHNSDLCLEDALQFNGVQQ